MSEKNFQDWIALKEKLHFGNAIPKINEGDVWWCGCGENVSIEINGKSQLFSRPVFILKKLGRLGFIGVSLTSQEKTGSWYVKFDFQGRDGIAVLSQIRTFSVSRLSNRMGKLDQNDARKIRDGLKNLIG